MFIINNIVSYKTKIINANKVFDETVQIYRKALSFIINVVNNEWDYISPLKAKEMINFAEKLIYKRNRKNHFCEEMVSTRGKSSSIRAKNSKHFVYIN